MLYFIINPIAGNGLSKKVFAEVSKKLDEKNIEYDYAYTEYEKHATVLAKSAYENGYKSIISIGGDGTVLEAASGIFYTDACLGIIPGGTGNDLIKAIGIPNDPLGALDVILNGHSKIIDAGLCDDRPFINSFGTGLDAHVVIETNRLKKVFKGSLAYLLGIFAAFFKFKPRLITVEFEDMKIEKEMMFLILANGTCIGGGIQVAPQAIMNDGYLDLVVIDKLPKTAILKYLKPLSEGRHENMSFMHTYKTKKAHVTSSMPLTIQIDGEVFFKESVDIKIQEKALKVYAQPE